MGGTISVGKTLVAVEKVSVWDLTAGYIKLNYTSPVDEKIINQLLNDFCKMLDNGYTYQKIAEEIRRAFCERRSFNHHKFAKEYRGDDRNLLKQGKLHVMHWLNLIQPPVKSIDDFEQGTYRHVYETKRFYCEPIASMTVKDVMELVKKRLIIDQKEYDDKRLFGITKYLTNKYGIEITLFMIYIAETNQVTNKKPISFNRLEEMYSPAKSMYEDTLNFKLSEEVLYIVPKQRMLFNRNRI